MKKGIIIAILVGMLGWAVYDFVVPKNEGTIEEFVDENANSTNQNSNVIEEDSKNDTGDVGLSVGMQAPDFTLKTLDGETVSLSDFRGQKVMINFWATWCPPCRAEMPDMQKFYEDEKVVILAVNLTETESSKDDVYDFRKEFGLTFPILIDENLDVGTQYQIRPIPTSFMIDTEGIIQHKATGPMNYEQMVEELKQMN
ncbi:TlpA disulfide reductase family protein [Bacillaceae bacterium S4-13-58]